MLQALTICIVLLLSFTTPKKAVALPHYSEDFVLRSADAPLPKEKNELAANAKRKVRAATQDIEPAPGLDVPTLIRQAAAEFGANPELALRIAECESGYNPAAKNRGSTASGVYQFLSSTWANQPEGKAGYSVFNAEANVRAGVRLIAHSTSPWNASKSCWSR